MRALERLFIFAIVSIASLLVFNLHEKHAELHKRDGEWSVRKDLQQVVEKEKNKRVRYECAAELRKALSEEKLNNYGARVRSGIEEPNERIIDSLRNRIESETGEKKYCSHLKSLRLFLFLAFFITILGIEYYQRRSKAR